MQRISDAARFARGLSAQTEAAEIWRRLKTFIAPFGFTHLTVLKHHAELPARLAPSIVYIDAPRGFAEAFDRALSRREREAQTACRDARPGRGRGASHPRDCGLT